MYTATVQLFLPSNKVELCITGKSKEEREDAVATLLSQVSVFRLKLKYLKKWLCFKYGCSKQLSGAIP